MKLALLPAGELTLEGLVSLGSIQPLLNGIPLGIAAGGEVQMEPGELVVLYSPFRPEEQVRVGLALGCEPETGLCSIRCWVEGDLPELDSFGLRFGRIDNLRAFLRNGYTSWDGSCYAPGAAGTGLAQPVTGYAMTQLLPQTGKGSLMIGFDRHDRFQQTFTFDRSTGALALTILTLWDRRARPPGSRAESERLLLLESPGVEEGLRAWASLVAAAAPIPPRLSAPPLTGWCSWYNLYGAITEENILEHLRGVAAVARREHLPMRVFQIDDGFTPEMGDWLDVKPAFPRGIKPLLDDIRAAGFVPGLWIAPFMVGNRSRLFRDHPDWVVRDRLTGGPLVQSRFYGEFRWFKRSEAYYILDTTHPAAFDYLRRVFRTWRHEWGCEYFKTDFMYWGSEHGPGRALWHGHGLTRIEIWRRVAEMIRAELGQALWLGCGCPLWASIGLVDGVRISGDSRVEWPADYTAPLLARDLALRNFTNQLLWQIDPDCILLREQFHYLSETQVQALALYAGMSAGVIMTSDALDPLSPGRLQLWKLLLNPGRSLCRFPLLEQSAPAFEAAGNGSSPTAVVPPPGLDPVLVQVRASLDSERDMWALYFFNTAAAAAQPTYSLSALGLAPPLYLWNWTNRCSSQGPVKQISLTLGAQSGQLFFASHSPILTPPTQLP